MTHRRYAPIGHTHDGVGVPESVTAAIADNASAIQTLSATVTTLDGEVTTLASDVTAIEVRVTDIEVAGGSGSVTVEAFNTLEARVTVNEGGITANASDITTLETNLSSAEANITANATAVSALDTRVTTTESSITAQSSDITTLQSSLTTLDGTVSGQATALSSLTTRVTSAEGTIDTHSSQIAALSSTSGVSVYRQASAPTGTTVGDLWFDSDDGDRLYRWNGTSWQSVQDAAISGNASAINTLSTRVTTTEGDIDANAADITSLESAINTVQGNIAANATAITNLTTRVTSAEGTLSSQASSITSLQSSVNGLNTTVGGQATAISSLNTRVTSAEGTISSQSSSITSLQASVGTINTTVGGLSSAVSDLDTRVNSAEGTISSQSSSITSLQSSVSLKARTFRQSTTPTASAVGDIWIHTGANNSIYRWNGSSWVATDNTNISANATAISGLNTRVTAAEGNISSQASLITSLDSRLDNVEGTNTTQATAISNLQTDVSDVNGDISALSSSLTNLTTTVGTNTSNISTLVSTTNGLEAQYTVKIDNNGFLSGFGLASTPATAGATETTFSEFSVLADSFKVRHPGTATETVPFSIVGGLVRMQNVRIGNAVIDDLTITKLTTGTLNADMQLGTGRIIFDNGTHLKAQGIGFGSSNQFIEWFGPRPSAGNLNLCTEANAIQYLKTNGDAYFGGALSAGTLFHSRQTASSANNAEIILGPFGTNGAPKTYSMSYTFSASSTGSQMPPGTTSATVRLYRRFGSGAETLMGTINVTGTRESSYEPEFQAWFNTESMSDSITVSDPNTNTSDITLRAVIVSRSSFHQFGITQNITVTSTEE